MGDHYEVLFNHVVTIGKGQPLLNFKQYLQDIFTEFDKEITKTIYGQVTNSTPRFINT